MINFNSPKLKMENNTGYNEGGAPAPENTPTETPAPEAPAPVETPAPEAKPEFDDYGYPVVKAEDKVEEKPEEKPEDKVEEKPEEDGPSATGYDEVPPKPEKAEEKPEEIEKPEDKPEEETSDIKIEDKGDLLDSQVDHIMEFAKKHKLSQAVVDDMVADGKARVKEWKENKANREKENEAKIAAKKSEWHQELKDDPKFGGENFKTNVKRVDKVINEFLPNIKKELTDSGVMLAPYIMRDFANLANQLYKTEGLVQGEVANGEAKDKEKKGDKYAHLEFYKS